MLLILQLIARLDLAPQNCECGGDYDFFIVRTGCEGCNGVREYMVVQLCRDIRKWYRQMV